MGCDGQAKGALWSCTHTVVDRAPPSFMDPELAALKLGMGVDPALLLVGVGGEPGLLKV